MIRLCKTSELKVGMYVIIPVGWLRHPFLTNRFSITSQNEIARIVKEGYEEIEIDTEKTIEQDDIQQFGHGDRIVPAKTWEPAEIIPDRLNEALRDIHMEPRRKAAIVYDSSREIMAKLLQDPKSENINVVKAGIADIVDMILREDETETQLVKLTAHDYYTYTHSVNVGFFSVLLSKALFAGSDIHDMHELGAGFFLHDIGKVRIDPAIINKTGRLTDDEMNEMKKHPFKGYQILTETGHLTETCRAIVLEHHERYDGTGYPRKLKGDEIHLYGKICCIADVYDALTAERSYKTRISPYGALKIMEEEMLNHFEEELFRKFVLLFAQR